MIGKTYYLELVPQNGSSREEDNPNGTSFLIMGYKGKEDDYKCFNPLGILDFINQLA